MLAKTQEFLRSFFHRMVVKHFYLNTMKEETHFKAHCNDF